MAGSRVTLREDWEGVKVEEMYKGNKAKFEQNKHLAELLTASKGPIFFGGSTEFWCKWNALIMERLRAELRQNGEEDLKTIDRITQMMHKYKLENTKK